MFKQKNKTKYCYAVKKGLNPGVYFSWDECKKEVDAYKNPIFKKFSNKEDALKFINDEYNESDLKLTQEETANLSINDLSLLEYIKKDKNLLDLKKINNYNDNYYIFTDGSSKAKNYKIISSGIGIYFGNLPINISQHYTDKTNNYCELNAIKYVLSILDLYKSEIKNLQSENPKMCFNIVSDSKYSIDSINDWMNVWQKNGWKTKTGTTVKNQDIFKELFLLKTKLKIHKINYKIIHVNSHKPPPLSDDYEMFLWKGNQYADYLATYNF